MVPTDTRSVSDALLVLDHARAEVQTLQPGDEVFLPTHVAPSRRAVDDSGWTLHRVVRAERVSERMPEFEVVTDRVTFRCSPRYAVYLIGHQREQPPKNPVESL